MTRSFLLLTAFAAMISLTGCGKRLVPVSGNVTLDGKAVEGASVTFVSDDGKYSSSAITDESGNFSLENQAGPGAYPGNYKVVIAKYPKVENASSPALTGGADKDYEKHMKKEMDASKDAGKGAAPKVNVKMGPGMKAPGAAMLVPGGATLGSGAKSQLPEIYASIEKTPLTCKVPPDGAVQFDMKSK